MILENLKKIWQLLFIIKEDDFDLILKFVEASLEILVILKSFVKEVEQNEEKALNEIKQKIIQ